MVCMYHVFWAIVGPMEETGEETGEIRGTGIETGLLEEVATNGQQVPMAMGKFGTQH